MSAYTRELVQWGICAARKAQVHPALSGVVYVVDTQGKGSCKIKFAEPLADAVGLALPQGISPEHPAFLKVMEMPGDIWRVFAFYLREERGTLLYETVEKPAWLKNIKRADHGKSEKSTVRRAAGGVRTELRRSLRAARLGR